MATSDDKSYLWDAPASYAENEHILAWWGESHDEVVARLIAEFAWTYPWKVSDAIVAITPEDVLVAWQERDPVCKKFAWYNVLLYFAVARARTIGLEEAMRAPETLDCLRCGKTFRQDEVRASAVGAFGGFEHIRYCQACCDACFFENDLNDLKYSEADLGKWLRDVAALIGAIPTQDLFAGGGFLKTVSGDVARTQLMDLAAQRPTTKRMKDVFGSWLNALTVSGVLPDGVHRTRLGVRSVAADGHVCLSIPERSIDDWLTAYGVEHDKEPPYPESNYRGDFRVGNSVIEFFGLAGDPGYDARILEKRALADKHGIDLIEIYPKDMLAWGETQAWLAEHLGFDLATRERQVLPTREQPLSDAKPQLAEGPPTGAKEGWYPDPTGRENSRWWDGRYWTHRVLDPTGEEYSDTPFPGRTDPTNRGPEIDGKPTWEFLAATRFPWPGKVEGAELTTHLELMFRCMDAVENQARAEGYGIAPAPYSDASGHLRHARKHAGERAVLARSMQHGHAPGAGLRHATARLAELETAGVHPDPIEAGMTADYPAPEG